MSKVKTSKTKLEPEKLTWTSGENEGTACDVKPYPDKVVTMLSPRDDLMTLDLIGQRARDLRIIELLEELSELSRK